MNPWKTLPNDVPVDGSTVFIRIEYYYSKPFLAVWDLTTQTFTDTVNSINFPAYVVARWRDL